MPPLPRSPLCPSPLVPSLDPPNPKVPGMSVPSPIHPPTTPGPSVTSQHGTDTQGHHATSVTFLHDLSQPGFLSRTSRDRGATCSIRLQGTKWPGARGACPEAGFARQPHLLSSGHPFHCGGSAVLVEISEGSGSPRNCLWAVGMSPAGHPGSPPPPAALTQSPTPAPVSTWGRWVTFLRGAQEPGGDAGATWPASRSCSFCVNLGKAFDLFEPQFPQLYNGENDTCLAVRTE